MERRGVALNKMREGRKRGSGCIFVFLKSRFLKDLNKFMFMIKYVLLPPFNFFTARQAGFKES